MLIAYLAVVAVLTRAPQSADDPGVRAAVERFYAAQEAEDADAYLRLWSKTAQRPNPAQLKYIFDSGQDRFSNITIVSVSPMRDGIAVRVRVTRDRTMAMSRPDGSPNTTHSAMDASLVFVREDGEWKLVLEGTPVDTLAALLADAPTAEERETVLAAHSELGGPMLVMAISRQAAALAQRQQYDGARAVYEIAREMAHRIGARKLEAEALQNIGNTMYFLRDLPAALAAFEQRLSIEREIGAEDGIVSALLGIASVRYAEFEYTAAMAAYRDALALQEKIEDEPGRAMTLYNAANIQYIQGDFAGAIEGYRRGRDVFRKLGYTAWEARTLEGLGRTFTAQGDFAGALEAYDSVLADARARDDHAVQGTALLSVGDIHFRLGNLDASRPLFEESRGHFETLKDLGNVGRVWQATALTELVARRFAAAEQAYAASAAACTRAREDDCVARATVGLAFAQSSQEHFPEAVLTYRKAISAFGILQKREDAARAEVGLSLALLGTKDYAAAVASAAHARDEGSAIRSDDVVWRARVAEARALRKMGNPVQGTVAVRDAVATVERMAAAALGRPGESVPADSRAAYDLLALFEAQAGDAANAFAAVEQGRAHALRAALATNERDIARGMTPDEREAERARAADLVSVRAQMDREQQLPKPDAARIARLQERVTDAAAARAAQLGQMFERHPDLRTWRGLAAPVTLDEAAGVITSADTVVVELVIDDDDLLAIVGTRDDEGVAFHAHVAPISRRVLAERVAAALDPAVLRNAEDWRKASNALVAAFPVPMWSALSGARHAIVIPDGVLWRVPFEALPAGALPLADRTAVTYAGSLTSLVRPPVAQLIPPEGQLLAIGTPDLPAATRERVAATAPGWALRSGESGDAEIRIVTGPFTDPPAAVLSGAGATEAALRERAPAASALHFGAPFRINGASPLFSPLLLSEGTASGTGRAADDDGRLEVREVMNLELHARVALFSDGAAASMWEAAPAIETVRWAWRAAGVPAIVLPRWTGDESAAAALLAEVYKRLHSGEEPDAALQGARAALRAREETRAPYFWAAWMLIGP